MIMNIRFAAISLIVVVAECGASAVPSSTNLSRTSSHGAFGNVQARNGNVPSLLGSLLQHEFSLPVSQLRRGASSAASLCPAVSSIMTLLLLQGTIYVGTNLRMREALRRGLEGGRGLKIGVIGARGRGTRSHLYPLCPLQEDPSVTGMAPLLNPTDGPRYSASGPSP